MRAGDATTSYAWQGPGEVTAGVKAVNCFSHGGKTDLWPVWVQDWAWLHKLI